MSTVGLRREHRHDEISRTSYVQVKPTCRPNRSNSIDPGGGGIPVMSTCYTSERMREELSKREANLTDKTYRRGAGMKPENQIARKTVSLVFS